MKRRLIGWLVLVPLALVLVLFALANRHVVAVNFDPVTPDSPIVPALQVPLYAVVYAMLLIGIILGGFATWLTQGKHRKAKRQLKKKADKLGREVEELRRPKPAGKAPGKGLNPTDDLLEIE